jgi:hypothetical protein
MSDAGAPSSHQPSLVIETMLSNASYRVPIEAAWQWTVVRKYFETKPADGSLFCFPAELVDDRIIRLLIDFSVCLAEIKVAHIPGPLYKPVNLTESPYNVPKWAHDWMLGLDMDTLFDLFQAGEIV